jgi:hypothetical protein
MHNRSMKVRSARACLRPTPYAFIHSLCTIPPPILEFLFLTAALISECYYLSNLVS